jgi:ABC-type enterochelin transport system permease subunit
MEDTDKKCLLEEDLSSRVQSLIARLYRMTQQVQAVWEIGIISSFFNYELLSLMAPIIATEYFATQYFYSVCGTGELN